MSLTPDSSPRVTKVDLNNTIKTRRSNNKLRWNSSTKVEQEERSLTVKATPPRRAPSATGMYGQLDDIPPVPPIGTSYKRSLSRASMSSGRPWSPVTSSVSTSQSSHYHPIPTFRPPSRSQTPSRAITPGLSVTPRACAKTPSNIPAPLSKWRSISGAQSEGGWDDHEDPSSLMQRTFSPAFSTTSTSVAHHPPRPPSRSMIPVPSLHLSSPSRPSSSMSRFHRSESALRARAQQMPFYINPRSAARPSLQNKLPPSSFRDGSSSRTPSRPGSRTGVYTPTMDQLPMHEYIPGNPKDPLDVEVAFIVNSIAHGLLVKRIDPPLRAIPKR
jgi:hypothetical protein